MFPEPKNRQVMSCRTNIEEAASKGEIVEAIAQSCDAAHNLIVDLVSMKGIIPRCEGAIGISEGTVRDIALISRVGKPVCFLIDGFTTDAHGERIALLSRRKAQLMCQEHYISKLSAGDVVEAKVTHLENFGAFCDIGCGCVALLPIDAISVSRISHPNDRFVCGDNIKAVIKSITGGRITLSMKELLGSWQQNADCFCTGETVSGVVRSVEDYGVFVELAPNLAGLAELRPDVYAGQKTSVYIKSIIPARMKVKLVLIDSSASVCCPIKRKYYINTDEIRHIDHWLYSPPGCSKVIETVF